MQVWIIFANHRTSHIGQDFLLLIKQISLVLKAIISPNTTDTEYVD